MKGTFFSTDFVKDKNGAYKFLELNTDTAVSDTEAFASDVDLAEWFEFLENSSINTLEIIYKVEPHTNIVDIIKQKVSLNASFITQVVEHIESNDSIYPTPVQDGDNKFILRLAYDDSAILDSLYAKNSLNPLLLLNENNLGDVCIPMYYSSSTSFVNTLENYQEKDNLPDLVIKRNSTVTSNVDFYKVKGEQISGSFVTSSQNISTRVLDFINSYSTPESYISNFAIHSSSIEDNVAQSLRIYSIVTVGSEGQNVFHIYTKNVQAAFSLPALLDNDLSNHFKLPSKHYFELSTSTSKEKRVIDHGVFETERFISASGEPLGLNEVKVGDILESFHIEGLPDSSDYGEYTNWFITGSQLLENSYLTSSTVVAKHSKLLESNELVEIKLEGDTEYRYYDSGISMLVFESSSNTTRFISSRKLTKDNHWVYNKEGVPVGFIEANAIILHEPTGSIFTVDVEPTDIIITEGAGIGTVGLIVHNFDCFVAGTKITMEDHSQKNIEEIQVGEKVCTYNTNTHKLEYKTVLETFSQYHSGVGDDYIVNLKFNNGTINFNTNSHPYYVRDKGLCSVRPDITLEKYNLKVNQLEVGDVTYNLSNEFNLEEIVIEKINEFREPVVTYNLFNVENNHNYFANNILVHNKTVN